MSMHLHHPSLSLSGKKRGKQKFRSAEEARKARELDASWQELKKKWGIEIDEQRRKRAMSAPVYLAPKPMYRGAQEPRIPSLNGGADSAAAIKKDAPVYTGTKILGIGTMHKSNAVPIFSDDDAKAISSMRR